MVQYFILDILYNLIVDISIIGRYIDSSMDIIWEV